MKNFKTIAILALAFLAISCKKDEKDNGGGGTSDPEVLSMKINGTDWVADDNLAGFIQKSNNKANFGGKKTATNELLSVNNVEVLSNGTFTIDPTLTQNATFLSGSPAKTYSVKASIPSSRFTFTVTKTSEESLFTKIKGTFSGVLYASASDSIVITNGVYNFK